MRQIVFFDTSFGSMNQGDYIIQDAIYREMEYLTREAFVTRFPTHCPVEGQLHSILPVLATRTCKDADYKFINGTNIIKNTLFRFAKDWAINPISARLYSGSVLIGCGREINARKIDPYTKSIYRRALSDRYLHSVRDDNTSEFLEYLGFKTIVTGCPTTWDITQEHVDSTYSRPAASSVLLTLTDYAVDESSDARLVDELCKRYDTIYYWPQGSRDYRYAERIGILNKVETIGSTFDSYKDFQKQKFDYVGTRLHGGIFALAHGHRSLILSVDNRAEDMAATVGLNVVPRDDISEVCRAIDSSQTPQMCIPIENIRHWKAQFVDG